MTQKNFVLSTFLLTVTVFLFGCAAAPTATPNAPQVLATLPPQGDDILVTYHKSGGFVGIDETLIVHHGGLLELNTRQGQSKSLQVNEPVIQPLRRLLEQKDFGELAERYPAPGADLFVYSITARTANGDLKTVTTMDGAKQPEYLGILIGMLEQLRTIVTKNG